MRYLYSVKQSHLELNQFIQFLLKKNVFLVHILTAQVLQLMVKLIVSLVMKVVCVQARQLQLLEQLVQMAIGVQIKMKIRHN